MTRVEDKTRVIVRVPATSGNVGPGFDCLGVALGLYNSFCFQSAPEFRIRVTGAEAVGLELGPDNLAYRSFCYLFTRLGLEIPTVALEADLQVPLARGLGSSATAIVGGLVAANTWAGEPVSPQTLVDWATQLEGHPDNVAPALLGGCQLSLAKQGSVVCMSLPWLEQVVPVAVVPAFGLSTAKARAVLPTVVPREDALFNSAHLGLLVAALEQGRTDWLTLALEDRLHQPYRAPLVPGMDQIMAVARAQGAYGVVLSGAGPTLLALTAPTRQEQVAQAMVEAWANLGIQAKAHILRVDTQGTQIER
ncbi:homoserine kinase [Anthocerotibacter panamensis]|uniref:homoserine kinase n=1 Tax=Anthocerotibacter panamensis TaxID=2857077 RepID=UPI001C407155|nr:homoserine kinase [Anthocerotibacter panamensis]